MAARKNTSQKIREYIVKLRRRGHSWNDIAARAGVSKTVARYYADYMLRLRLRESYWKHRDKRLKKMREWQNKHRAKT